MATPEISEDEAKKLTAAMKRAREFELQEEKNILRQPIQGQLYKYTNVVKGWQYRWFVLTPEKTALDYYEREELKTQRPRGSINLAGATVSPSDEDSQTFIINASSGEMYKLKASSASERLNWVNRLRASAEASAAQGRMSLREPGGETGSVTSSATVRNKRNVLLEMRSSSKSRSADGGSPLHQAKSSASATSRSAAGRMQPDVSEHSDNMLSYARDLIAQTRQEHLALTRAIEVLPSDGALTRFDKELLILKAMSGTTVSHLEECCRCLERQQAAGGGFVQLTEAIAYPIANIGSQAFPRRLEGSSHAAVSIGEGVRGVKNSKNDTGASATSAALLPEDYRVNHEEEVEDEEDYCDEDLGNVEHHKSVILALLQQLKLGMDLTKVVLPTFILEKRSLLEMFADCMCHPDIFLRITEQTTAEKRMVAFLEWYLTSLHGGRQGALAKKPYNPIIGETFHCSWNIASDSATTSTTGSTDTSDHQSSDQKPCQLFYCAEQVSHHPPVTAFYFECPDKQMYMTASIWTRSKFMGMSLSVVMEGRVQLHLLEHGEVYEFSLPSAYARSILTTPWVELGGDRISMSCAQTGYTSTATFHTKPFYGGKIHRVTADVKSPQGDVVCRVSGEWNGLLEFTDASGTITKVTDVSKLQRYRKRVRPLVKQRSSESRRLWRSVTEALRAGDTDTATTHKRLLEEKQRNEEKQRKELDIPFPTKLFLKANDAASWSFKQPLQINQMEPNI